MLLKFLGKYRDTGLLFLRVGLGVAFILHGLPKINGGPKLWHDLGGAMGELGIHWGLTFWGFMAALSETLGGVFLILGFFYRPICLLLTFTMVVATLTQLGPASAFPKYSHPLKMAVVFFALAFVGPGRLSIDKD